MGSDCKMTTAWRNGAGILSKKRKTDLIGSLEEGISILDDRLLLKKPSLLPVVKSLWRGRMRTWICSMENFLEFDPDLGYRATTKKSPGPPSAATHQRIVWLADGEDNLSLEHPMGGNPRPRRYRARLATHRSSELTPLESLADPNGGWPFPTDGGRGDLGRRIPRRAVLNLVRGWPHPAAASR